MPSGQVPPSRWRAVLGRLPAALTVYGVEGATFTVGTGLSPEVAAGAAEAAARILEEVHHA